MNSTRTKAYYIEKQSLFNAFEAVKPIDWDRCNSSCKASFSKHQDYRRFLLSSRASSHRLIVH